MRPIRTNKTLTFGDFIASVYDACGRKQATGIVKLAVNARLVAFRGSLRYLVS
jgi:hypothetical protein